MKLFGVINPGGGGGGGTPKIRVRALGLEHPHLDEKLMRPRFRTANRNTIRHSGGLGLQRSSLAVAAMEFRITALEDP